MPANKRMRQIIKPEPGAEGRATGSQEEGAAQRVQISSEVLLARSDGDMAAGEIDSRLLRANLDAQALAFQAMEQARVTERSCFKSKCRMQS